MQPIIKEIDYPDIESVLMRLSCEENIVFLDSSKFDASLGRYSYIAVDPIHVIKSKNNIITVDDKPCSGNPFEIIKQTLDIYSTKTLDELPPFQGGAVGYFAYDLLHHLESIPRAPSDPLNVPDLVLGIYDCVMAFDHLKKQCWILSHGFPEKNKTIRQNLAREKVEALYQKAILSEPQPNQNWSNDSPIESNFSKQDYCAAIQKTIEYIYAGDIFQANITQCFHGRLPPNISYNDLYLALRQQNPAPFSAYLNFSDVCVASASPERFIRLQDGNVETRPIKGTRPRGKNSKEDTQLAEALLASEKDRAENTMIVDLMRNDLSRVCDADSVEVTQLCGLESYETVHHLVSAVEGKLIDGNDAIDLLQATFPPGSITGAPKVRAMEIISELETVARGVYCGSVGFIGFDGNMDTSVVIRTYILKDRDVYFQAGGGIVADSLPTEEYAESLVKARALRRVLLGQERLCDSAY